MEDFNLQEETLTKQYDSKLMKRLLKFAKPFKIQILGVVAIMFIVICLDLLRPYIIKTAIDENINPPKANYIITKENTENSIKIKDKMYISESKNKKESNASLIYEGKNFYVVNGKVEENLQYKIDGNSLIQGNENYEIYKISKDDLKIIRKNDLSAVVNKGIEICIIAAIVFFLNYIQIYILEYTGQKIVYKIRDTVFRHIESLPLSFFDKNPVGKLVTRVTNDVETLNEMYTAVLVYLFKDFFLIVGILVAMFIMDVKLAFISIITVPIILLLIFIFNKYDRKIYRKVRGRLSKINSSLSENITGMKTVQAYGKEDKKYKEFDKINTSYLDASMEQIKLFAIIRPVMDLIYQLGLAILIGAGGKAVLGAEINIGVLYIFINYIQQFFQPIFDLSEKFDIMQSAMASAERIFMIIDTKSNIENPENPINVTRFDGDIEFKNVWFAYNEEDWVLRDVSFKINKGETVAFVGATGAGKTSVISLISRLYDIQKGEILIDGKNIKHMKKEDLRKNLATVLQDVFLFTGDIKSNVRLNNEDITDKDIIKACEYVNASTFIEKLPQKYDSAVNERGTTFSQGERQLIAFARALAFNPPILVLDEATANIDTETESLIQDALNKLTKGRTTIVVAHRLSTIKNADNIIVMHKGKIREMGKHEELIKKDGLYSNLYKLQYETH